ncbi:thiolase family protein [Nocardia jiangxiensis]|uniref:Probable acetyl-CoA acetyltransferase n=1 Tax=Nocardia jiangxiensis TaxID=282685 RepID=A0ABW6SFQ6_9NOCA
MKYQDVAIPAGLLWSSPFIRWQGAVGNVTSVDLATAVTNRALADRGLDPSVVDEVVLGITIPQPGYFFGPPTIAGRIGIPQVTGPMVSQACATGVAALHAAAASVSTGGGTELVITTDRTSNGPTIVYPSPNAAGGVPAVEDFVQNNFACDPWAGTSMLAAAETVARERSITRGELDDVAVLRYEQYERALADDRSFQHAYMVPIELTSGRTHLEATTDAGVRPIDRAAIAGLRPAVADGVHTGASQAHPADGTAGAIVTTTARAHELSPGPVARILSTGFARVAPTHMPEAPVPAALRALDAAGLTMHQVDAITTHNPFAVNDIVFARETGVDLAKMNSYGCSLIWGHPQAPTGMRAIAELVTELSLRGGGIGLFTGCAAGDTAAALVVRVDD